MVDGGEQAAGEGALQLPAGPARGLFPLRWVFLGPLALVLRACASLERPPTALQAEGYPEFSFSIPCPPWEVPSWAHAASLST